MKLKCLLAKSLIALCILATSMAFTPALAQGESGGEARTRWGILRVQGLVTIPLGDNTIEGWNDCGEGWLEYVSFTSTININTTGGVLASFEYVLARRFGIEASFVYWYKFIDLQFEAEGLDLTVEGSPNFILPTIGLNYHFMTNEKVDIYGGGLISLGVIATGFGSDIEVSKDVALGLTFGTDYYVKKSWSLGATLKYIDFGELDFSVLPPGVEGFICDNGLFGIGHLNVISITFGAGFKF
jgi:outer membrane protein W